MGIGNVEATCVNGGKGKNEHGIFSIITPLRAASATRRRGVIHRVWSGFSARSLARARSDMLCCNFFIFSGW